MRSLLLAILIAVPAQGQDFAWRGTTASITVKNIIGDIRIELSTGRTVEVTAAKRAGRDGDPADVRVEVKEESAGVTVCVIYPGSRYGRSGRVDREGKNEAGQGTCWSGGSDHDGRNDTEVTFTMKVPAGVAVHAHTVTGVVDGAGIRGNVEATSVSGDVRLRDIEGRVVEATSVSGSVSLDDIRATEAYGETVSGMVRFGGSISAKGTLELATLSGDVVAVVPRSLGANVQATTFSGRFRSPPGFAAEEGRRRHRYRGVLGSGGATITLQSFSGDIRLETAEP